MWYCHIQSYIQTSGFRSRCRCSSATAKNESYIYKRIQKMSSWHVTLYVNRMDRRKKTKTFRNRCFSFGSCSFYIEWHVSLTFFVFFYRWSFHLVPKTSWIITYVRLQLSYTYSYTRCFGSRVYPKKNSFISNFQQIFQKISNLWNPNIF